MNNNVFLTREQIQELNYMLECKIDDNQDDPEYVARLNQIVHQLNK